MPLINCKVELSLTWNKNCILPSVADGSTLKITDTKLYVPVVVLKTEDNTKLSKLLSEGFKRSIYRNEYKVTPNKNYDANEYIRERLDASIQGVRRLFFLAYGKDQPINDSIKQYDETEKYQQDKVVISRLVLYWILLILEKITD